MAIPAKVQQEDEAAQKELEGIGKIPDVQPKEDEVIPPEKKDEVKEPQADNEVSVLKAKLAELEKRLNDSNNPTWEQRYKSLSGMIEKKNEENKELAAKLQDIGETLKELKNQNQPPKEEPKPEDDEEYKELVSEVGEKAAKIIWKDREENRKLREKLEGHETDLKNTKEATATVVKHQAKTAEERFYDGLSAEAKKYSAPGPDGKLAEQDFVSFLSKRIPGTNNTYGQYYTFYCDSKDHEGVNSLVDVFEEVTGKKKLSEKETETETPVPEVEKFLEPGKTGGGGGPPKDEKKKIYTQAEYDELEKSITFPGKFKGTDAERKALEDELTDALLEGRVR